MTKIYGLFGTMTGKLADTVMSVRNGVQIARKYQPAVYNPSTPAQVEQRAKLKLLSQLSTVMAPVIAIPRSGTRSSRNMFVKKNFPALSYSTDTATVNLTSIQLTNSVVSMVPIGASYTNSILYARLTQAVPSEQASFDRVVYCVFKRENDETLRFLSSAVASAPGSDNDWLVSFPEVSGNVVIYAYTVRDNTERARVVFGEMSIPSAQDVARLVTTRALLETDVTLSETQSFLLSATQQNTKEE